MLVKDPGQGWLTVRLASLVPTAWCASRSTVVTGAAHRWLPVAAEAAVVPDARTAAAEGDENVAAAVKLARSLVVVAAAVCSGGQG